MKTFDSLRVEHPSTCCVDLSSQQEEIKRLRIQDQLLSQEAGGVLAEQPDPTCFRRVLVVGCGSGGWLMALAVFDKIHNTWPEIPKNLLIEKGSSGQVL